MNVKSAPVRAVVVVLSLALVMSGMAHAGGSHAGEHLGATLAVTASQDAASADSPCDDSSNHGVNDACPHAAGCAFGVPAQAIAMHEPLDRTEAVQTIAEVQHGTAAAPPIRPPKLSNQA